MFHDIIIVIVGYLVYPCFFFSFLFFLLWVFLISFIYDDVM